MKTHYYFEGKQRYSDEYPVDALRVHAVSPCGKELMDVAVILDPNSVNPALLLTKPLGFNGVRDILDSYKRSTTLRDVPFEDK